MLLKTQGTSPALYARDDDEGSACSGREWNMFGIFRITLLASHWTDNLRIQFAIVI